MCFNFLMENHMTLYCVMCCPQKRGISRNPIESTFLQSIVYHFVASLCTLRFYCVLCIFKIWPPSAFVYIRSIYAYRKWHLVNVLLLCIIITHLWLFCAPFFFAIRILVTLSFGNKIILLTSNDLRVQNQLVFLSFYYLHG